MAHLPKILVAGYGPWAKAENNPAAQTVEELRKRDWRHCDVSFHVLPVRSDSLASKVNALLEDHRPDAWIGIGVSDAGIIQPEMVGINWRHFGVPDVAGATFDKTPILTGGPDAYNATLPNAKLVDAVIRAGIPAALSFHAGTHLCNQMLYTAAHLISQRGMSTLQGFIHVPQTPGNIAMTERREAQVPSMSLPMITEAIAICIDTLTEELTTQQPLSA
ncbi:pyroglutamyl-peptidase I [Cognatishimia activa]|uniref:pyroglutamyl-peptidase I n=1 Tax=Cognatishimia activa TaxID=1715691 RepID=UPI0022323689|nr:pyroglutamyl-peptidase I [Cognatishimia activa]UZD89766.1 pyroglutamyl-peptidase I [Cognatishimia activa]